MDDDRLDVAIGTAVLAAIVVQTNGQRRDEARRRGAARIDSGSRGRGFQSAAVRRKSVQVLARVRELAGPVSRSFQFDFAFPTSGWPHSLFFWDWRVLVGACADEHWEVGAAGASLAMAIRHARGA